MLVLFETSLGFCLFRVTDSGKLQDKQLWKEFENEESANRLLKLQAIHRFTSTATAVEDLTSIGEGKLSKNLKKFLTEEISAASSSKDGKKGKKAAKPETLLVAETKLGQAISKKLEINVVSDSSTQDLFRGIRSQLDTLLSSSDPSLGLDNLGEKDLGTMTLGLGHSLSRYKLKFSPDKVDTMIIQAIALLDDLDKEVNIYAMRVKEWYGWHFPEMAKIITDNLAYAKVIQKMGFRTNVDKTDFSEILPEDVEAALKAVGTVSMGTEISSSDLEHINLLASQVISISSYRSELYEYLRNRMAAIAPNITALLGELVGARLISHSGSLMQLSKHPASTVQILGAEKALFRALKTKHDTPKYGLIFHASLVGQAPPKLKGKMARMVATKTALACRVDSLADADSRSSSDAPILGIESRAKLEARLRSLEQGLGMSGIKRVDRSKQGNQPKFQFNAGGGGNGAYNTAADVLIPTGAGADMKEVKMDVDDPPASGKKDQKKKRKAEEMDDVDESMDDAHDDKTETKEERRRRKAEKKEAKAARKAAKEAKQLAAASTAKDLAESAPEVGSATTGSLAPAAVAAESGDGEGAKKKKKRKVENDEGVLSEKEKKKKEKREKRKSEG